VPFFVFDRRFAVSGAQPAEVFTRALEAAREASTADAAREAPTVDAPAAKGHVCDDDSCAV
jgi:hypothetical protein